MTTAVKTFRADAADEEVAKWVNGLPGGGTIVATETFTLPPATDIKGTPTGLVRKRLRVFATYEEKEPLLE